MKKIFFFGIAIVLMTVWSCKKNDVVQVSYFVTNSNAGFWAYYLTETGELQYKYFPTQSKNDKITLTKYLAEPGDIVYVSVTDTTINSFVTVKILIDGKVYKEASRTEDVNRKVTVSGTVPY